MVTENRKSRRFKTDISQVLVRIKDKKEIGKIKNLSMDGAYIEINTEKFVAENNIHLKINVENNKELQQTEIDAIVSRVNGAGIGVRFNKMDLKTFKKIRSIAKIFSENQALEMDKKLKKITSKS
jgi:hypothetical protein